MGNVFCNLVLASGLIVCSHFSFAQNVGQNDLNPLEFREGVYEVPVNDPNLADAAVFKLRRVQLEQNGTDIKLKYRVPVELTGEVNQVEFIGSINNGEGTLVYEKNKMNCLADQSTLMCKVAYQDLKFNQVRAERILSAKFNGDELRKRLLIQGKFSTDPVGVIKIKLK
jgi:hypothetical protein